MASFDINIIARILSDFAWHADRGQGDAMSQLFIPEGTLRVGGQDLAGRQKIADDCHRRALDPLRVVRHVCSNLRLDRVEASIVTSTAIQITFEQLGEGVPAQVRVNDLADTFVLEADGVWRIASRIIQRQIALTV